MNTSSDQVAFNPLSLSLVCPAPRGPLLGQSYITRRRSYINASSSARVYIKMVSPEALDERPIEHRRDILLKLEISIFVEPFGVDSPEYCIRVPRTKSVKKSGSRSGRTVLDLSLEVLGATTGKALMFACHTCSNREYPSSASVSMVDFVAKEDLIDVKQGKAYIAFRFLCLSAHHGTMDKEYRCAISYIPKSVTYAPSD